MLQHGAVPRRYVGSRSYVSLRETAEDALRRAIIGSHEPVNKHTHMLLRVHSTPHGLAHDCTCITSAEHWFSPLLTKKLFPWRPNGLECLALPWRFASATIWARRYRVPLHRVDADRVSPRTPMTCSDAEDASGSLSSRQGEASLPLVESARATRRHRYKPKERPHHRKHSLMSPHPRACFPL